MHCCEAILQIKQWQWPIQFCFHQHCTVNIHTIYICIYSCVKSFVCVINHHLIIDQQRCCMCFQHFTIIYQIDKDLWTSTLPYAVPLAFILFQYISAPYQSHQSTNCFSVLPVVISEEHTCCQGSEKLPHLFFSLQLDLFESMASVVRYDNCLLPLKENLLWSLPPM